MPPADRGARVELDRRGALLDERRASGFVRQCHGDLHLRNIVLLDGRPTLFDGVEFNDKIACTDVLYDLAFLLMDLWRRRLPRHANAVWNRYLADTGDFGWGVLVAAVPLMPRGGPSQDECDGSKAPARCSPRQRASGVGSGIPRDGGGPPAPSSTMPCRDRRVLRDRESRRWLSASRHPSVPCLAPS